MSFLKLEGEILREFCWTFAGFGVFMVHFVDRLPLQVICGHVEEESKAALSGEWPCPAWDPFGIPGMLEHPQFISDLVLIGHWLQYQLWDSPGTGNGEALWRKEGFPALSPPVSAVPNGFSSPVIPTRTGEVWSSVPLDVKFTFPGRDFNPGSAQACWE